jgi:hypothetical protein
LTSLQTKTQQIGIERIYHSIVRAVYANISTKIWNIRQGYLISPFLFNIVLKVLARAIRQEKEIKSIQILKKKENLRISPQNC